MSRWQSGSCKKNRRQRPPVEEGEVAADHREAMVRILNTVVTDENMLYAKGRTIIPVFAS